MNALVFFLYTQNFFKLMNACSLFSLPWFLNSKWYSLSSWLHKCGQTLVLPANFSPGSQGASLLAELQKDDRYHIDQRWQNSPYIHSNLLLIRPFCHINWRLMLSLEFEVILLLGMRKLSLVQC